MQTIDYFDFEITLDHCGWAHSDWQLIKDKVTGVSGFRYILEECDYNYPTLPFEELQRRLLEVANVPEKVIFGAAQHRYAPEICRHTVIILD